MKGPFMTEKIMTEKKVKIAGLSGLMVAGIGSICCVGPAIFAGLGLGAGALSVVRSFGVLHMPMMILAFVLFGFAFYFHFSRANIVSPESDCCESEPKQAQKTNAILWTSVGLTLFMFALPFFI